MFIFPQNADDIINLAENTELRIPFALDGMDNIQLTKEVLLTVEKVNIINNTNERLCTIFYTLTNKSYLVPDSSLHCRSVVGLVPLLFAMNVSRQDDGTRLTWRVIWRQGTNRTFLLNITCKCFCQLHWTAWTTILTQRFHTSLLVCETEAFRERKNIHERIMSRFRVTRIQIQINMAPTSNISFWTSYHIKLQETLLLKVYFSCRPNRNHQPEVSPLAISSNNHCWPEFVDSPQLLVEPW